MRKRAKRSRESIRGMGGFIYVSPLARFEH